MNKQNDPNVVTRSQGGIKCRKVDSYSYKKNQKLKKKYESRSRHATNRQRAPDGKFLRKDQQENCGVNQTQGSTARPVHTNANGMSDSGESDDLTNARAQEQRQNRGGNEVRNNIGKTKTTIGAGNKKGDFEGQLDSNMPFLKRQGSTITNDVFRQMEMERQSANNEEFQGVDHREDLMSMTNIENIENQSLCLTQQDSMRPPNLYQQDSMRPPYN